MGPVHFLSEDPQNLQMRLLVQQTTPERDDESPSHTHDSRVDDHTVMTYFFIIRTCLLTYCIAMMACASNFPLLLFIVCERGRDTKERQKKGGGMSRKK